MPTIEGLYNSLVSNLLNVKDYTLQGMQPQTQFKHFHFKTNQPQVHVLTKNDKAIKIKP